MARNKIHFYITIAVMLFIFVHSAMPGDMSGAESNLVVRLVAALTGLDPEPLGFVVRKTAHFTEFMVLGLCLRVNVRDIIAGRRRGAEHTEDIRSEAVTVAAERAEGIRSEAVAVAAERAEDIRSEAGVAAHASGDMNAGQSQPRNLLERGLPGLIAWAAGTFYAATDEIHQMFVPDRVCAFTDVCIDSAGVLLGTIIMTCILHCQAHRGMKQIS